MTSSQHSPELHALSRKTSYACITLIVWCLFWETVGAPLQHAGYWLALKGFLLLPLLPKLWRGERYTYQVLSLLILLYVLEGLLRTFSDTAPSRYFAVIELLLSTLIFIWVNQFALKTKAAKPQREKKNRKMSWLLYAIILLIAMNLTLPSTHSSLIGAEDANYIHFKTALEWLTAALVIPYVSLIVFYRFKTTESTSDRS
ncbi:DUF2069 domain-containing protein [Hydromonas duriensis]|uniref:Putative membrane protein n=1 Tax=Hydromonas duriensis TaxID=1527608 RepID=A0A4R6YB70_9BURK|nr:DUF2069 domain-containing protein [Hydromonas duriensis]TDR32830.1 putative membrane protein [Hydromonas duriensis]